MIAEGIGRRAAAITAAVAIFLLGSGGTVAAQAPDPDAEKARQLILRIRSSMRQIDRLLLEGAGGAAAEAELAANQKRFDELLDQGQQRAGGVVADFDELIKLGKQQQGQSGASSGPPPPPQGSSPQGGPTGKDNSGSMRPKSQEPHELPQQSSGDKKRDGEKPESTQERDGQPQGGEADPRPGEQREGGQPPPGATGVFERTDLSGRWGMLPPKEAEELQRRSADEFPQRYRPWMELYFRRMSRLPARR
jgi:hypothetical protein